MADNIIELQIKVNSETNQLELVNQKLGGAAKAAKEAETVFGKLEESAKRLLTGFIAFGTAYKVIDFFQSCVKEAEAENEAIRKLSFALESNQISWEKNGVAVNAWARGLQESTRFSDTQAYEVLGKMVRVTGDLGQAQMATKLAMDMSVVSGRDLNSTQETVINLYNGNTRALREVKNEYGSLVGNVTSTKDALIKLQEATQGAADREDSFTKNTAILKNQLGELKEAIGNELIPIINNFLSGFIVPKEMNDLTSYIKALEEAGYPVEEELRMLQSEIENTQKVIDDAHKQLGMDNPEKKSDKLEGKDSLQNKQEFARKELEIRWANIEEEMKSEMALNQFKAQKLEERMGYERKISADTIKIVQGETAAKHREVDLQARAMRMAGVSEVEVAKWVTMQKTEINKAALKAQLADTVENLRLLAEQGKIGKDLFKAFAITQTIISTYEGAQHAFTSLAKIPLVGPALGAAAAAVAVAAGMTRVSMIQSMHTGGTVPGSGDVPINMEGGEFVVRRDQVEKNRPLLEAINKGSSPGAGGGSNVNVVVNFSTGSIDLANVDFIIGKLAEEVAKKTANAIRLANGLSNLSEKNSTLAV